MSRSTISDMTEQHDRFSTQALQNIEELQNRNLQLMEELEGKDAEIRKLQEELEKAGHREDLIEDAEWFTINIDCAMMGVGGDDAWGARPHNQYMLRGRKVYRFR